MSHVWIKMDDWNRIIDDINKVKALADFDPSYRLFFKGIEVHHFTMTKATNKDINEWLGIWIYSVGGKMSSIYSQDRDRGYAFSDIAHFDKWYCDEEYIRKELKDLEVRKVDVVKSFK